MPHTTNTSGPQADTRSQETRSISRNLGELEDTCPASRQAATSEPQVTATSRSSLRVAQKADLRAKI